MNKALNSWCYNKNVWNVEMYVDEKDVKIKKKISVGGLIFKNPKLFSWNHTHIQTKFKQIKSKNNQTTCKSRADSCQCMAKTTTIL